MRRKLLVGLLVVLVLVAILTWGSVGSAMICLGILIGFGAVGYQKFLTNRDDSDYFE